MNTTTETQGASPVQSADSPVRNASQGPISNAITGASAGAVLGGFGGLAGALVGAVIGAAANVTLGVLHENAGKPADRG